jgi:hypothetical protein
LVSPGFEGASPSEILGKVLCGDAVEAGQPLLEAAVVGVDIIDVKVRPAGVGFPGAVRCERESWPARERGDGVPAVTDQMVARQHDASEDVPDRVAVDLRQDRVKGCAFPVASDKNGDILLIEDRMPGRSAPFARLARQVGSAALEGFEDEPRPLRLFL